MLCRRAQSITEYMLFFTAVAFALVAMNTYIKRGVQGTVKSFSNMVGQQEDSELKTAVRETSNIGNTTTYVTSTDNPSRNINREGGERFGFGLTQQTYGSSTTDTETGK